MTSQLEIALKEEDLKTQEQRLVNRQRFKNVITASRCTHHHVSAVAELPNPHQNQSASPAGKLTCNVPGPRCDTWPHRLRHKPLSHLCADISRLGGGARAGCGHTTERSTRVYLGPADQLDRSYEPTTYQSTSHRAASSEVRQPESSQTRL